MGQCKAKTKAREQGKSDQLPQTWRHIQTVCELNAGKVSAPTRQCGSARRAGACHHNASPSPPSAMAEDDPKQKNAGF